MTTIVRLLSDREKQIALKEEVNSFRTGLLGKRSYIIEPDVFSVVEGSPFAYWIADSVKRAYLHLPKMQETPRENKSGLSTADDFRFLRLNWEIKSGDRDWKNFSKGGRFSRFYFDLHLTVNWRKNGRDVYEFPGSTIRNPGFYFRPGLTWPSRTKSHLSVRVLPENCVFGHKGPSIFVDNDSSELLLALLAICNSLAYYETVKVQLAAAADAQKGGVAHSFEVGVIQKTPMPNFSAGLRESLAALAQKGWSMKRRLDTLEEISHAFVLPEKLRARLGDFDQTSIEAELEDIQVKIDDIAFDLYSFSDADRAAALGSSHTADEYTSDATGDTEDGEDDDDAEAIDQTDSLLSWAVGVAFGRFDLRLATGEREAPPEPGPFDPLPAKSPGMLPDGAAPFHAHGGILVDDQGQPHDLPRLIEEVLARVEAEVPGDVRRWLQRDFFPLHFKQYSKSRRKAPIYWPLSTTSGSYTLWLYYPSISSQTLYSAVNDFVEPKLKQVSREADALRDKGVARSRDEEKSLEALQAIELELMELRDTLLHIAPTYRPNHDDGVQITAAPLWQLFRYKPWQKILKDTWAKLEKGEYDWAHLAMAYWPDRVREKCKTDKSLAIAHELEPLYIEPKPRSPKSGKLKKDAE